MSVSVSHDRITSVAPSTSSKNPNRLCSFRTTCSGTRSCERGVMCVPVNVATSISTSIMGLFIRHTEVLSRKQATTTSLSSMVSSSKPITSVRRARYSFRRTFLVSAGVGENSLTPSATSFKSEGSCCSAPSACCTSGYSSFFQKVGSSPCFNAVSRRAKERRLVVAIRRRRSLAGAESPQTALDTGTMVSSKAGMASAAGRLFQLIRTFPARGVSGNSDVINECNSAPALCPMPTTGRPPYSSAKGIAA
mmetsp:Transcript_19769/g.74738  ORF Transcript_19769/g.74738 Transcript_19769/m.74738 type:complete len:250 (-) Transcript_19769:744-1493(-)